MNFKFGKFWGVGAVTALIIALSSGIGVAQEKNYQALSLEDCLSLARQYNPVLAGSREKIQELVADYQAARSKFFPRLVLTSFYDRQPPNRFPPGGSSTPVELFKREGYTGVYGKQLVFDGLKTYYNTQAAKTGTQAQKQEVQRTADEVAYTVTEAFYRLMEAKENLQGGPGGAQPAAGIRQVDRGFLSGRESDQPGSRPRPVPGIRGGAGGRGGPQRHPPGPGNPGPHPGAAGTGPGEYQR